MSDIKIERLKDVNDFESLIKYLRDELLWPIELENADDITFDYNPKDLGIEEKYAAKIRTIKQIRPFTDTQPWGIFFIEFEPKKLPVIVMRRILRALIHTRRSYDDKSPTWNLHDLMLISSLGEEEERKISFAHFTESEQGLPELRTFSWDTSDTHFHYLQNTLDLDKLHWPRNDQDTESWRDQWSSAFTRRHREVIRTSQQLAVEMARLAAQIRDQIKIIYEYEIPNGPLHKLFGNFKSVLIHDLDINNFADMYAQTIAYGLFSARVTHEGEFIVEDISAMIPNTNPFLKKLFEECTNIGKSYKEDNLDLDEIGVTELIKTLKESNIEAVLQDFGRQKRGEDPVVHFYELFLREYDAEQKVKRGVFYTPDPVVSFIVRSVDYLLKTQFDCPDGLADTSKIKVKKIRPKKKGNGYVEEDKPVPKVQILDPAVGTGTFLKHVIDVIKKTFDEKNDNLDNNDLKKAWNNYVAKDLLSRLFGFELMMAPYAVCHLKLGLELAETGYDFQSDKRLGVYLTNTLEGFHEGAGTLDAYYNWLAEEGHKANIIKAKNQINVIIGNPPYAGHSANKSKWIYDLLRGKASDDNYKLNYFEIDGKPLDERNPKWLNDDYVKFIRFGQWRIDKTDQGILAFITNHSYLDNPTFRGMRQQLLNSFSEIYVLDLHGNVKKKEKCPDGSKDENVFDIQQGVAIGIFIKNSKNQNKTKVYHADLWGNRESKNSLLLKNGFETVNWKQIEPTAPYYFFIPQDYDLNDEYEKGWKITDIMTLNSVGIVTARDKLTIKESEEEIWNTVIDFSKLPEEEARDKYKLGDDVQDWKVKLAQKDVIKNGLSKNKIVNILYRPFDIRYTYYTGASKGFICRPRSKVMSNMLKENIGLITCRQQNKVGFDHAFISNIIIESCVVSNKTREINYIFPLYKYSKTGKIPNIDENFANEILKISKKEVTPEDILSYIYAVLFSLEYRVRYSELLKRDFPRIPITRNSNLFYELSYLGNKLISTHLLKNNNLGNITTTLEGEGDNIIGIIGKNNLKDKKFYINKNQYFDNVTQEIYNFQIGSYKVCQKWIKDRKGYKMKNEDVEHFQMIIDSINETIKIMKEIDEVIKKHGGWPIK